MTQLTDYIVALANLYGIVSFKQVMAIYNRQNEKKLTIEALEKELEKISEELERSFVYIEEGLFVHEAIYLEEETPQELFQERKDWPYYEPEKEELLRYVDEYYFEKNEMYKKIEEYLTVHLLDGDSSEAEEIMTEIYDHLTVNFHDLQGALGVLEYFGISLENSEQVSHLIDLIGDYAVSIRVWEQNGYSLQEMNDRLRERANLGKTSLGEIFQEASLLERYIISLTHLYGRVTKEKIVEVYNAQNETAIDVEKVEPYLAHPPAFFEKALTFVKYGEFISEDLFLFEDSYEQMVEAQKRKPFYMPNPEELFLYFDANYTEYPKEYEKLVVYLQKKLYKGNETKARMKAEDIQLALEMGAGLHGAFYELKRDDYIFEDQKQINELTNLLKRLNNNTRMRENNGFTPRELSRIEKEQKVKRINIGRNDPCYCGSGKKYKKCCLKKDQLKN